MKGTKYQQYYERTKAQHSESFAAFREIHDLYAANPQLHEAQFNAVGQPVVELLRATERQLCAGMERGGYGTYSNKLSEKFWQAVKKEYPQIDFVGVVRKFTKVE